MIARGVGYSALVTISGAVTYLVSVMGSGLGLHSIHLTSA
jgi:hypothetical protein